MSFLWCWGLTALNTVGTFLKELSPTLFLPMKWPDKHKAQIKFAQYILKTCTTLKKKKTATAHHCFSHHLPTDSIWDSPWSPKLYFSAQSNQDSSQNSRKRRREGKTRCMLLCRVFWRCLSFLQMSCTRPGVSLLKPRPPLSPWGRGIWGWAW